MPELADQHPDAAVPRATGLAAKLDDITFLAVKLGSIGTRAANVALAGADLRVRPFSALALTVGEPRPTQRELAEQLALDPSQIVSLVDGLEASGLVTREPDPADRRSKIVIATEAGERAVTEGRRRTAESEAEILSGLTAAEFAQLRDLLAKAVQVATDA